VEVGLNSINGNLHQLGNLAVFVVSKPQGNATAHLGRELGEHIAKGLPAFILSHIDEGVQHCGACVQEVGKVIIDAAFRNLVQGLRENFALPRCDPPVLVVQDMGRNLEDPIGEPGLEVKALNTMKDPDEGFLGEVLTIVGTIASSLEETKKRGTEQQKQLLTGAIVIDPVLDLFYKGTMRIFVIGSASHHQSHSTAFEKTTLFNRDDTVKEHSVGRRPASSPAVRCRLFPTTPSSRRRSAGASRPHGDN
jgi:hypothetical protein